MQLSTYLSKRQTHVVKTRTQIFVYKRAFLIRSHAASASNYFCHIFDKNLLFLNGGEERSTHVHDFIHIFL